MGNYIRLEKKSISNGVLIETLQVKLPVLRILEDHLRIQSPILDERLEMTKDRRLSGPDGTGYHENPRTAHCDDVVSRDFPEFSRDERTKNMPAPLQVTPITDFDTVCSESIANVSCLIKLAAGPAPIERLDGIDFVFVVDRSGSMKGEKMSLVIASIESILRNSLLPIDRFALVTFAITASLDQDFTNDVDATIAKLNDVRPNGGTNIPDGFRTGLNLMRRGSGDGRQSAMIFLTDGMSNVGSRESEFRVEIEALRPSLKNNPMSFFAFGFGTECDADMLKLLSSCTSGGDCPPTFQWIRRQEQIAPTFGEAIGAITTTMAWNVTLHVVAESGCRITKAETGAENVHQVTPSKRYEFCFGPVFADEVKHVLLGLSIDKDVASSLEQTLATCYVTHTDENRQSSGSTTAPITITREHGIFRQASQQTLNDIQDQRNRISVAEACRLAETNVREGRIQEAIAALRNPIRGGNDPYTESLREDLEENAMRLQQQQDNQTTSFQLSASASQHSLERGGGVYVTSSQTKEAETTTNYVDRLF